MTQSIKIKALAAALTVAAAAGGVATWHQERVQAAVPGTLQTPTQAAAPTAATARDAAAVARALPDLSDLVARNESAVVNIAVRMKSDAPAVGADKLPDGLEDTPFGEFLRRFGVPNAVPQAPDQPEHQGVGSGFIVSSDGDILTNAHVVANAREIVVKLSDRREFPAKVVGVDKLSDVALVRIDATGLPTVKIGNAGRLRVGQWVLAIGAPFGFDRTATQGIVSALHRNLPDDTYIPFIQTDVPINPGNSGGPLFDTDGNVVGINSQIYSRTGGYMGLSFAIPIDIAMDVAHQLKTDGRVTRGWLGVALQEVNQDLAKSFGLDRPRGALVADVDQKGPGKRDGLAPGDIIVSYDGHAIESGSDLPPLVGATRPGERKSVAVIRDGKQRQVEVTVGKLSDGGDVELGLDAAGKAGSPSLGIGVAELDAPARQQLGLSSGGVLVEQVGPGRAAKAGVRAGDVLVAIDGTRIRDVPHLKSLVGALPQDRSVPLMVKRQGGTLFLALKPQAQAPKG
jgi:serine protease Do